MDMFGKDSDNSQENALLDSSTMEAQAQLEDQRDQVDQARMRIIKAQGADSFEPDAVTPKKSNFEATPHVAKVIKGAGNKAIGKLGGQY